MPWPELPDGISKAAPGVFGSAVALLLVQGGSVPRRAGMFLAGSALSFFATPDIARISGLSEGFSGFILGLFGMTIAAAVFDAISKFGWGQLMNDWLRKLLGLPPKEGA